MKKVLLLVLFLLIGSSYIMTAQTPPQPPAPKLKPTFIVEDIYFAYQTLDNVEITGSEVEAFLQVKEFMKGTIKKAQEAGKQTDDKYEVELAVPLAQNMLSFLNRAKLTGRMAEQYKRFVDALIESSKALSGTGGK